MDGGPPKKEGYSTHWGQSAVRTLLKTLSRSETCVPKRGGLKPAGKRQESATFLQRSFFDVAVQFFVCCSAAFGPDDFRTEEKSMLQCSFCSAAFRKLQPSFRFRLWHVARAGFRGVGFRTCWLSLQVSRDMESIAPGPLKHHHHWRDKSLRPLWHRPQHQWCINTARPMEGGF